MFWCLYRNSGIISALVSEDFSATQKCLLNRAEFIFYYLAGDLSCLQLYGNEHCVTLNSPFLSRFLPPQKHCYFKTPSSRPTGGVTAYQLSQKMPEICAMGRQTGRAAVQIGQTVDIPGMCKRSQLLAEGAEWCQGSAVGEGV